VHCNQPFCLSKGPTLFPKDWGLVFGENQRPEILTLVHVSLIFLNSFIFVIATDKDVTEEIFAPLNLSLRPLIQSHLLQSIASLSRGTTLAETNGQ